MRAHVAVGRHQPPASARVADFMAYFAQRYAFATLSPARRILAIPAAHHRFNFIHPFADGNGRVSRLMSHAMALQAGIGAHRTLVDLARARARSRKPHRVQVDDGSRRHAAAGRSRRPRQSF